MKKLLGLLAALLLFCAAAGPSRAEGQDAVSALLDQLAGFMDAREQLQEWLEDCSAKTGDFYARRDYPSLARARLACSETLENLRQFEAPRMALNEEVLDVLIRMKTEVIELDDQAWMIRNMLADGISRTAAEELFLHSALTCREEGLDAGEKMNSLMKKGLSLEAEYTCNWLNSLLLPLSDDPRIDDFWNSLPDRWPRIARHRQPWVSDAALSMEAGLGMLNEAETLADERTAAAGMNTYNIQRILQDPEAREEEFRLPGSPSGILPLPSFWMESEGKRLEPDSSYTGGEEPPAMLTWYIPEVSAAQYTEYIRQLTGRGFQAEVTGSEQDGMKAAVIYGGKPALIYWSGGKVFIACHTDDFSMELR